MPARDSSAARLPVGRDLMITRTFDAPRERVFEAWTVPERLKLWHGPKGYTCPSCTIDPRVGGRYLACMRSPEGQEIWSTGVYREIVPGEKIVCTDSFSDAKGNIVPASHYGMPGDWPLELLVTVTFEKAGGKTRMTLRHAGLPPEILGDCETGWSESFDKLADSLVRK